ncbi:hypothetical protein Ais01nite_61980 [Asanoa ishikariensis]|uniref:Uncharacterized protein n=1 Tax=Asanoa ishikariensis TaxID=137265 RepID=A0A1H3P2H8_9ACTN|nr:hypothetical protein [Asanoa ishikariensis]GIF68163.1 hypothetical protein Ais01nite_61980 [Asanoa ishikariensis]SDY95317.1 hypothetical protein SAMN05421684_2530 [Asanoa ishikariensis]
MLIDCSTCAVRGAACRGCLVTALLDAPAEIEDLDASDLRAIEVFARAGFEVEVVSAPPAPLRMVRPRPGSRSGSRVA